MSCSYRKPYCSICGCNSSRWDKTQAHRGERRVLRKQIRALTPTSWELSVEAGECWISEWREACDTVLPHDRLTCPHNNTYGWSRDGGKMYYGPPHASRSWSIEENREWATKLSRK